MIGQISVRWAQYFFFGYGHSIFNYFYPLPYYLDYIFHYLGLTAGDSIKVA